MNNKRWEESTHYEILEVATNASGREIHAAYLKARETYSPDSPALYTMFTPEEARELLKLIDDAYNTLGNLAKRQEYDLKLARKGHPAFKNQAPAGQTESATPIKPISTNNILSEEGAVLRDSKPLAPTNSLPEGFAKTRFGVYEINSGFENELKVCEECDGQMLQKLRQYKKVSLEQLSDATRISKSFLAALESNAYDALPAQVFIRGFVLQYARALGAPDKLADAYMKRLRQAHK